jgi:hypothetical protein
MSITEEFFDFVHRDNTGLAVIALVGSSGQPTNQKFFQWPAQREQLIKYCIDNAHKDVYTSPSLFKGTRARKANVKSLSVVHADADTFEVSDARVPPSGIAETSPGKTHLYWLIEDSSDPSRIEPLSHSVSDVHKKRESGLDDGWACNKLMRVPGTTNTKYSDPRSKFYFEGGQPFTVTWEVTGEFYTLAEFAEAYPPAESVLIQQREMGTLPSKGDALKSLRASPLLMQLLNSPMQNVDRSDALFKLTNEIFRCGGTDEVAFVIAQTHPFNKFHADGKYGADELLWADIQRARHKSEMGLPEVEDNTEVVDAVVTIEPSAKDKMVDFLSAEEKDQMASTFISDYLAWASSKTDAAEDYHIAGAFTLLSTVFSDYGHAMPKFGRLPLNLWFMVLGSTTRSRKSTSRDLMLLFVNALADEDNYRYELGSDFTGEALDNALLERPNRSALLHRDEFQGLLVEIQSKAYMSGMANKMTDLYGGRVSGKLRATGEQKRRASVNAALVFYAMGIEKQVAQVLSEEDFQSGFLTRFVYVMAEPPTRTPESDYLEQANINEVKQGDPVFTELLGRLENARDHWDSFVEVDGPTQGVPCTTDAWARLNRFITDVLDAAEGHEKAQIIEASAQRLTFSILKAATLLAMFDTCDEVELPHMLAAINYCSTWFVHMVTMANNVSASMWRKKQEAIEEFLLSKGGSAKWEVIYKAMNRSLDMRPREFAEVVTALQESGIVNAFPDEKQERWIQLLEFAA